MLLATSHLLVCYFKAALLLLLVLAVAAALTTKVWAGTTPAGPDSLSDTESLADVIAKGDVVHIVYVHGIRAEGPGAAAPLVKLLATLPGFSVDSNSTDEYLDLGPWPSGATYFGQPLFTEKDWVEARPFVRHYQVSDAANGKEILVDEVNYWPLLFPLKCRYLLVPEHDLSGDNSAHLKLCDRWLRPGDRVALKKMPAGGHAALLNRVLKQQIMNWGLSDAVVALGSMRIYLNRTMELAFRAASADQEKRTVRTVIMSESLGSFVVLDAVDSAPSVKAVFDHADDLYFFANQVPLLELARIEGLPEAPAATTGSVPDLLAAQTAEASISSARPSLARVLARWGAQSPAFVDRPLRQLIAFSDPSDILTYPMPSLPHVKVVNVYDRNTPSWFGLIANPGRAHTGHLKNKAVWKLLIERRKP